MRVLFLGHFSNSRCVQPGASAAGDAVQRKIAIALKEIDNVDLCTISQPPARTWPKGNILLPKSHDSYATYPRMINIAIFRDIWFGFLCLLYIIKFRPERIIQYNSYFFVNLLVLLSSTIVKTKKIIIIQDFRTGSAFKASAKIHDLFSGFFVRHYDLVIPVTIALADKLKVKNEKRLVFPGAMESDSPLTSEKQPSIAVSDSTITVLYAGALEKHNGLDKLICAWEKAPKNFNLIIYGKGSLEKEALMADLRFDNVTYLGFASKDKIHSAMLNSDFNVCFRFGEGLDEKFFFPSKFFSINCYPGFSLINDFYGLPENFRDIGLLVTQDLSNLFEILSLSKPNLERKTKERQNYLYSNYIWSKLLADVIHNK